jgi:hypothetical protein
MSEAFGRYIEKQSIHPPIVGQKPQLQLQTIVIIPACNEPGILTTLNSLLQCQPTTFPVEVLILFNHSEFCKPQTALQNQAGYQQSVVWAKQYNRPQLSFYPILMEGIKDKDAGVGYARKTLMDEAIIRFNQVENTRGVIVSLDADSTVSENYLAEIEKAYKKVKQPACTIFGFEHPLHEPEIDPMVKKAIIKYELYLRYYRWALALTGFPYPFYTIGSCFAVSAEAYVKQGGMNRRQAGEDFYFLNKIFLLDNTIELNHVTVYPSPRVSDRVPFGTGAAVTKIIGQDEWMVYQPLAFTILKILFSSTGALYRLDDQKIQNYYLQLPEELQLFIPIDEFIHRVHQINQNAATEKSFVKKFFAWFDAFKIIKFLNFIHNNRLKKVPVANAALEFLSVLNIEKLSNNEEILLKTFRDLDRTGKLGIFKE